VSRIYAAWNYQTKEIEYRPELPSNYTDYIPPVCMARFEHYVAQGESPIEAALKVLSTNNAACEQDLATLSQIDAGRKMGEALGALRPVTPPQPRPNVTPVREQAAGGCLWMALMTIGLLALVAAGLLLLVVMGPWLERVVLTVAGWAAGHPAVAIAALAVVAVAAFRLVRRLDEGRP